MTHAATSASSGKSKIAQVFESIGGMIKTLVQQYHKLPRVSERVSLQHLRELVQLSISP